jgi:outer membrane protein
VNSLRKVFLLGALAGAPAWAQRVLSLDEALKLAARQQPALLQADALAQATEGRREQSRAALLPQVSATALYQRAHGNARASGSTVPGTAVGVTANPTTNNVFSTGLSASQVIWDFGAIERFRSAGFSVDAQRASARASRLQVDLQVRSAYFLARTQQALVDVAKETLANQLKHQAQVEGFARVGIRPEIDLAQARTAVASAQLQLVSATNGYLIAKAQLRQAVGGLPGDFEVGSDELQPIEGEQSSLDALTDRAVQNRPEMASLLAQRKATSAALLAAQSGYMPTVGAAAGISEIGTAVDQLQPNWQFGFTLTWNLFQGGLTAGQVHEQEANADVIDAELSGEQLAVQLQVEQAQLSVQAGLSSLQAAQAAEASARLQLQLAEARYTQGVGSIIELGDAQVAYSTAAAQRVTAQLSISAARAQLLAALGQSS